MEIGWYTFEEIHWYTMVEIRHVSIRNAGTGAALTVPAGNVGIGTATPAARLEVTSPTDTSTALYIGNSTSTGTTGLYFSRWGSASAPMGIQGTVAGIGANPLVLQAQAGNVGMGTTSPTYKLDVSAATNYTG